MTAPNHQHGHARRLPRAKGELLHHLEQSHPEVVNKPEPHRWTIAALKDLHDGLHASREPLP